MNHKSYEPGGQRQEPGGQAQRAPRRDSSAEEIWIDLEWWEKSKKNQLANGKLAIRNGGLMRLNGILMGF